MPGQVAVQMKNVSRTYALHVRPAVHNITVSIPQGEFVAVRGKSGSGKTTMLNLLGGLDRPSSGVIQVGDQRLETLPEAALSAWRGRHVGIVFQFFQLLPTLTALENVVAPMEFAGRLTRTQRLERARTLLSDLGLEHQSHQWPATLSGGQQQRVALARALANDPTLLLADEPTGNLDSESAAQVFRSLAAVARRGTTVIMITHDPDAAGLADRVITLADGRLIDDSSTGDVS